MVRTVLIGIILFSSCVSIFHLADPQLTLKRESFVSNNLVLNGYFYKMFNNRIQNISFLFQNGVIYDCGGNAKDFTQAEDYIKKEFMDNKNYKDRRPGWGVFQVENDQIWIEKWYHHDGPEKIYIKQGEIINKKSFRLTEIYRMINGEKKEIKIIDEEYNYKEFKPKLDSTNNFIK